MKQAVYLASLCFFVLVSAEQQPPKRELFTFDFKTHVYMPLSVLQILVRDYNSTLGNLRDKMQEIRDNPRGEPAREMALQSLKLAVETSVVVLLPLLGQLGYVDIALVELIKNSDVILDKANAMLELLRNYMQTQNEEESLSEVLEEVLSADSSDESMIRLTNEDQS